MSGRFVVIEGADGAGTTTQANRLADELRARGEKVLVTAEPSTHVLGKEIRARLKSAHDIDGFRTLALLFAADRLDHLVAEVRPALARGEVVISDRYVLSSLVYQSLHLDTEWVRALNRYAPAPDFTFLLEVDVDTAFARLAARPDRDVFEERALQARVHALYRTLAPTVSARVIDGNGLPAVVTERLLLAYDAKTRGSTS